MSGEEPLLHHISSYDYHLPRELIAQRPAERRDASRLLAYDRASGRVEHTRFSEIGRFLREGDLLVLNDTRVFRNRLYGRRRKTGGRVEVFLLEPPEKPVLAAITRSGGKLADGETIDLGEGVECRILSTRPDGERTVEFNVSPAELRALLERRAQVPLPPYIKRPQGSLPEDESRYQTVYARREGAVAAPTAGLHFTPELLDSLRASGVRTAFLTLHVGRGTFEPVRTADITRHKMHSERYTIPPETAEAVNETRDRGGRIVAVGTTCVRVLESVADDNGRLRPCEGSTDIFIRPPYRFRAVDVLITNFHLPRSTLLMLVSAFAGRERILALYEEAVKMRYRFFSYGDAMLIT